MTQRAYKLKAKFTRNAECQYLLYTPPDYEGGSTTKWPLVLFLHGAGERGDNLDLVKVHGLPKLVEQGKEFPFIIVSPQCPGGQLWSPHVLGALLDHIEKKEAVDRSRIYVTGLSMGGYGTWELAKNNPKRFAAIAPICGGAPWLWGWILNGLPIWAFHGDADTGVLPAETQGIIDRMIRDGAKPKPKFTLYKGVGHDSWTRTYNNPRLYEWLLKQRNGEERH